MYLPTVEQSLTQGASLPIQSSIYEGIFSGILFGCLLFDMVSL